MQDNYDIPLFKVFMSRDVLQPLCDTLMSGKISQYDKVNKFEDKLKEYLGTSNILTLNSGTTGLHLAYHLLEKPDKELNWPGLNEDDEVLTPALTCVATNWPILANNLKIKWVDINPSNVNININDLKSKLTKKTKIICVVHWGGYPVDLDALKDVQDYAEEKFGFRPMIIEDAAHAFGSEYKNKKLGNHGNIVMYSLQAIKHLTTGDGGLLILPTKKLYERGKNMRFFGIDREKKNKQTDFRVEDNVTEWGYKFHMNDINATIGLYNLPHVIKNIEIHRENARYYHQTLHNLQNVTLLENKSDRNPSWWLFTLRVKNRDSFIEYMKEKGVCTSQVHGRNDIHSCVDKFKSTLDKLDKYEKEIVCIPVGYWITPTNREYIVKCIKEWDLMYS